MPLNVSLHFFSFFVCSKQSFFFSMHVYRARKKSASCSTIIQTAAAKSNKVVQVRCEKGADGRQTQKCKLILNCRVYGIHLVRRCKNVMASIGIKEREIVMIIISLIATFKRQTSQRSILIRKKERRKEKSCSK